MKHAYVVTEAPYQSDVVTFVLVADTENAAIKQIREDGYVYSPWQGLWLNYDLMMYRKIIKVEFLWSAKYVANTKLTTSPTDG